MTKPKRPAARKHSYVLFVAWGEYEDKDWRLVGAFKDINDAYSYRDKAQQKYNAIYGVVSRKQLHPDYDWSEPPRIPRNPYDPEMNKPHNWDGGLQYAVATVPFLTATPPARRGRKGTVG
jgi:hypothetical protein